VDCSAGVPGVRAGRDATGIRVANGRTRVRGGGLAFYVSCLFAAGRADIRCLRRSPPMQWYLHYPTLLRAKAMHFPDTFSVATDSSPGASFQPTTSTPAFVVVLCHIISAFGVNMVCAGRRALDILPSLWALATVTVGEHPVDYSADGTGGSRWMATQRAATFSFLPAISFTY